MKTKLLTLGLFLSFFLLSASAQKKQTSDETDFMKRLIFSQFKSIFQPDEKLITSTQKNHAFLWDKTVKIDKTLLSNSLDTVVKNFLCEKNGDEIEIKSKFPSNFEVERELFSIDILDYQLRNEKGETITLETNNNFLNFGNEFNSSFDSDSSGNTVTKTENVITLNRTVSLKTKSKKKDNCNEISIKC